MDSSSAAITSNGENARREGVPFSWEQHPGIPKKSYSHSRSSSSSSKFKDPSTIMLPLPPAASPNPSKRFDIDEIDPFTVALMNCSKDHHQEIVDDCWKSRKVSRTLSDRFGFIDLYGSCKRSGDVSESIVLLPRSNDRAAYHLLNRRSR